MFTKILYPTDFSDTAGKSLQYIKALRNAGAQKIVLLNVINQRILDSLETIHKVAYFQDGRYEEDREATLQKLEEERRKMMAPLAAELEAAKIARMAMEMAQAEPVVEREQPQETSLNKWMRSVDGL